MMFFSRFDRLCRKGDACIDRGDYEQALVCFQQARALIGEPAEEDQATTWVQTAIGDAHFSLGQYWEAIAALLAATRCPGGLGNPFIHLRLGQAYYEVGEEDLAIDDLLRAYMGDAERVFETEDEKYFKFLSERVELKSEGE